MKNQSGGLVRPRVTESDAQTIARECFGFDTVARELGSNQDRNFLLEDLNGLCTVLRIDNEIFGDDARDAQHAALEAYRTAGVTVPAVLPGLDGKLTQRWNGFAARLSEFAEGEPLLDAGYLAPVVLREFGKLAAASVNALAPLTHTGLGRDHMWDMRVAGRQTSTLSAAIADSTTRTRVLDALDAARTALEPVQEQLPVQAIHGDLTDDNVMGVRGDDTRLHPHTVLDFGDLSYGWRVAELAVTVSSLLHHDAAHPLRTFETIEAFHRVAPLTVAEARAVWPLVVLRACLLVASGHRQLEIDGDNDYARERIAGEQRIFDSAVTYPLAEMTEQVLARLGFIGEPAANGQLSLNAVPASLAGAGAGAGAVAVAEPGEVAAFEGLPLRALLPALSGDVSVLDPGVESAALDAGRWLSSDVESQLVADAFTSGAAAAVFPYGVYRLTRTQIDTAEAAPAWPVATEIWFPRGTQLDVHIPVDGTVRQVGDDFVIFEVAPGWLLKISGLSPVVAPGTDCVHGTHIGTLALREAPGTLCVALQREGIEWEDSAARRAALVTSERVPAWRRFTHDPASLLGLPHLAQRDESDDEQARRERIFASAQERYYERPMQIERGWKHHLIDTTGRSYVDVVNNVTGLGHGHQGVADAANRQIRTLSTNSRFLYRQLAEYSERLLELLPADSDLDTVLLVNSGSEAVDLALRLAQAATGRKTVVALREAYHGWTMASDAVTTSAYDNPFALHNRPDWVHIADVPNRFRGTYRGEAGDATVGAKYAADFGRDLDGLSQSGREVAGFICESVLGNAGGVLLPDGYLADVYAHVRAAGGLCIADEIQVGFGRMGSSFWGFEQSGVVPDIITIAKPMGNGFPVGGVITSKRIADALSSQGQFFSSAGGNPLSCTVGLAVLDAMRDEHLQENARTIGGRLADGFRELAKSHDIIGPIHGEGLYLGVELVRDRETMEPATEETAAICERLRELGVIVLATSERSNVLKVKPPLCLTAESADFVVKQLGHVLSTGW